MIHISTSCLKGRTRGFENDVFHVLDNYNALGISNIELGTAHLGNVDISRLMRFRKENGLNFNMHALFPPVKKPFMLHIGFPDQASNLNSMQLMKQSIELLNKLEGDIYSFHAPYLHDADAPFKPGQPTYDPEKIYSIFKPNLLEIIDFAKAHSIRIAIENHPAHKGYEFFASAEYFERIFSDIKDRDLGMLIDLGHLNWSSNAFCFSKQGFIDKFKPRCFELHVSENDGTYDHHWNVRDAGILSGFSKAELRKIAVTLEAFRQSPEDIMQGKAILESALL